ncbi:MAG: hypothetical protein CVV35_00300 [Methanomicrobiales archaeon HGW-Methanomicrobiales-6]|nr:MAG: hypothetical protein CVV35_00300 [Methanomicrobiales archaeon HGW-Methanomicrobiales-6]
MSSHARPPSIFRVDEGPPYNKEDLTRLERENQALRGELAGIQRQITMMNAMQADVGATPEALQRLVDARIRAMKSSGEI